MITGYHVSVIIKSRYIKLTSPLINILICLGAILMYLFLGIPTEYIYAKTGLCNVHMYLHEKQRFTAIAK